MTKKEKLIVSAYTGVLMTSQEEFREFCDELLGRHIQPYEYTYHCTMQEIKEKVQKDFMEL